VGSQWLGLLSYPLLEIHEIHVSSQWLGLLNCSFLEIHVGSQWLGLLSYPLLEIHEIHVSSQWLGLLNCSFLEIHKSPQAPQIHRSTEPGSSPDLLDLSYAAMQILTVLIYCFYRQLLIQHASRNVESVYSQSHFSAHSHLCRTRFDCAAGFALLNLPKGKSLGRSKPATSSYAQALQHTMRKTSTISKSY
jgi:hypothetical protein